MMPPRDSPLSPVRPLPAWARVHGPVDDVGEAAFLAGAALSGLDQLVRAAPPWAGAWRQRLALAAAATTAGLVGRREDAAAIRDAWCWRGPGGDAGPAGRLFAAWQRLATRAPTIDADGMSALAALLGVPWSDAFADLPRRLAAPATGPAPLAAAALAGEVLAISAAAGPLAWALADVALARGLGWPCTVPLLATRADRRAGTRPADLACRVLVAAARAAADACRLGADMAGRADRLLEVAPRLRAKGAAEVVARLLEEEALAGTLTTRTLSRWAARRLFDRLSALGAVRELSGRASFRLYGL